MNYTDIYKTIFQSTELRKTVMVAISKAAFVVLKEPVNTPNHTKRVVWAKNALLHIDEATNLMIWPIASSDTVLDGTYSDDDIQLLVDSLIDTFANVS